MLTFWSEREKKNKLEKRTDIYLSVPYFHVLNSLNIRCIYSQGLVQCQEPQRMLGEHVRNE